LEAGGGYGGTSAISGEIRMLQANQQGDPLVVGEVGSGTKLVIKSDELLIRRGTRKNLCRGTIISSLLLRERCPL